MFPKNRGKTPQNGWFIVENLIKKDDLGMVCPLFLGQHPFGCRGKSCEVLISKPRNKRDQLKGLVRAF